MTHGGLGSLVVVGSMLILVRIMGSVLLKNHGWGALLVIIFMLVGMAGVGVLLALIGGAGMVMAPTLPRKLFALYLTLGGLWVVLLLLYLALTIVIGNRETPLRTVLDIWGRLLLNPASLLPPVKINPELFVEHYKVVLKPYWQPVFTMNLMFLGALGLGVLIAWDDYVYGHTQGIGVCLIIVMLPVVLLLLKRIIGIIQGTANLVVDEVGFSCLKWGLCAAERIRFSWNDVREFKIINIGQQEFVSFDTITDKQMILPNFLPISNQDLLKFMENRQEYYLHKVNLIDPFQFAYRRWWEQSFVAYCIIGFPILVLFYSLVLTHLYPEAKRFF